MEANTGAPPGRRDGVRAQQPAHAEYSPADNSQTRDPGPGPLLSLAPQVPRSQRRRSYIEHLEDATDAVGGMRNQASSLAAKMLKWESVKNDDFDVQDVSVQYFVSMCDDDEEDKEDRANWAMSQVVERAKKEAVRRQKSEGYLLEPSPQGSSPKTPFQHSPFNKPLHHVVQRGKSMQDLSLLSRDRAAQRGMTAAAVTGPNSQLSGRSSGLLPTVSESVGRSPGHPLSPAASSTPGLLPSPSGRTTCRPATSLSPALSPSHTKPSGPATAQPADQPQTEPWINWACDTVVRTGPRAGRRQQLCVSSNRQ